jgi:hypothetical protein
MAMKIKTLLLILVVSLLAGPLHRIRRRCRIRIVNCSSR